MKFQLQTPTGRHFFTGYGAGYVLVNDTRFETSLVVTPARVIEDWRVAAWDALNAAHFEYLRDLGADIVLLGTGVVLRFPHPALTRCLTQARIGLEVMDTPAACRTYNILLTEDRNVAVALLPN